MSGLLDDSRWEPEPPANVRAVLRVGTDFFLRNIDAMARLMGGDLILALV